MLPSGLPDRVADPEALARFLTSSSQFNSTMPKPSAFLPNSANGETSVFRCEPHDQPRLREQAKAVIGNGRSVHGVAFVTAGNVRWAQLEVEASEPPPFHANIVNWPPMGDDRELCKAQRKERAAMIASRAELLPWGES